jgi:penicillin amidase
VPGIHHAITIRRDRWGIPYISAENDDDAWFGLGFCHGQDRAFQLETQLRIVRGTLAEQIGEKGLPVDCLSRRIGFLRSAKRQLELLSEDTRAMLVAYAAGVNAGATIGSPKVAHEFVFLRGQPTPWTAADALGLLKMLSFALVSNWDVELARYKVFASEDGEEALRALEASYAEWQPVTMPPKTHAGPVLDRLSQDIAAFNDIWKIGGGSNNWAVSATRTRTGRPILANDPHLPANLPPYWYLAQIRTPAWAAAGASFIGGPIFPAGHNGHGAWGVTVGLVDDTDLFLEEVGPDCQSVRQGKAIVPCESWVESIAVKDGDPHQERVLLSPRGPIISSLSPEPTANDHKALTTPRGGRFQPRDPTGVHAFSLRATWLDPWPVRGLLGLHRVRNFQEFRQCFAQWPGLSLNMAYADTSGTIGWQLGGMAPRRRKGFGTLPLPGWDDDVGWHADPVPFAAMPYVENPASGFLATANNKPVPDGDGPFLSTDYADGYRVAGIVESLAARADWDVASTLELQLDVKSLPWREMKEIILACPATDPDVVTALHVLRDWDGQVGAESAGAAVYEVFVAEMCIRVAKAKAPHSYEWAMGRGSSLLTPEGFFAVRRVGHLVRLLRSQPPGWFERSWPEEIADALAATISRVRAVQGNDPANWAWGRFRTLTLRHPFGTKKPFNHIFNLGPYPFGGDANTIAQASVSPLHLPSDPGFLPSLRMVVDVDNWSASRFSLPGGQSGNPLSPHYSDQIPVWLKNEGVAIAWTEAEIAAAATATLRLSPAEPRQQPQT